MNIDMMRQKIKEKEGELLQFKFNGSRNQVEEFSGEIIKTYPAIFIIRLDDDSNQIKSFTYNDLVTESLEILPEGEK